MNYDYRQWIILLIVLIPSSLYDIIRHKINLWFIAVNLPIGIMLSALLYGMPTVSEYFVRFFPGIAILSVAYLAKGCIGAGDGIVCLFLGSVLNFEYVILSVFLGFLAAALFGLIMLSLRKYKTKSRFAFIPFLTVGVILCGII